MEPTQRFPHFLRFARAVALVSTAAAVSACAATVGPNDGEAADTSSAPDVIAPPPGSAPWRPDGWVTGVDTGVPYPPPDGWVTGVTDAVAPHPDAGIATPPDAGPDAEPDAAGPDVVGEVVGGPLVPPALPAARVA